MKTLALHLLAVSVLAGMAQGAAASATSAGGIGPVTITLIDLDPDDGITPSIMFAPDAGGNSGGVVSGELRSWTADEEAFREFRSQGFGLASSVDAGRATPMASAGGSITGQAGAGFAALAAHGQAGSGAASRGSYDVAAASAWVNFTLSANTAVRFSASGWARGTTSTGGDPETGWDEAGGALVGLHAAGADAGGTLVWDDDERVATAGYTLDEAGNVHGEAQSWSGLLAVSFSNLTGASADGIFTADARAFGHSAVTAVPEPATGAMLLGGLGIVGAIARRRTQQGAA
jgi:PEP-CTERM motif